MQQVTNQLVNNAKTQAVKISGPVRLPNKHLRICCRRTPCGEGSKTWDNWEMTIYKRYIDLECTASQIKEVTSITIPNGIEISVDFRAAWLSHNSDNSDVILTIDYTRSHNLYNMTTKKEKPLTQDKIKALQEAHLKEAAAYKQRVRPLVHFLRKNKLRFSHAQVGSERVEFFRLDDFEKLIK